MNGKLKLPLTARTHFTVCGGPSHEAPKYPNHVFVKMAAEIPMSCEIDIPTQDFRTPPVVLLNRGLHDAVVQILGKGELYVGCMAGRGRTGLFLAILARAFGVPSPVEYVRENYYSHAVETDGQYHFVMDYQIPAEVEELIRKARFWQRLKFWQSGDLTNQTV